MHLPSLHAAASDRLMATPTSSFRVSLLVFFLAFNGGNAQAILERNIQAAELQTYIGSYYGAKATIGVHGLPTVPSNSSSAAFVELVYGDPAIDVIRAGWQVRPDLYGDTQTHLFTYWAGDELAQTGGFDLQISGFVVNDGSSITPGDILSPLSTNDEEKYITLALQYEPDGWWLYYSEGTGEATSAVGHWPGYLFDGLAHKATSVGWGGAVEYPTGCQGPPMGSGQHASEGLYRSASFRNILFSKNKSEFRPVVRGMHSLYVTAANCYDLVSVVDETSKGLMFFFGGPAGCTKQ